jgi:membrane protein DedA with SNARE-associated domain
VLNWLTHLIEGSAWAYPAIVALVAMDGLVPMVPGEGAVLTASILAADGHLSIALVLLAAFAGAVAGDSAAYGAGRLLGGRAVRRVARTEKSRARVDWTRELIRRRGRSMIFIGRFIPGGRVAVTLASGSLGMSWRRFLGADVPAAGLWAVYVSALGFLGGNAFEHSLWKPLLLAAAVAALVTAAGEAYRRLRLRHPAHRVSTARETG